MEPTITEQVPVVQDTTPTTNPTPQIVEGSSASHSKMMIIAVGLFVIGSAGLLYTYKDTLVAILSPKAVTNIAQSQTSATTTDIVLGSDAGNGTSTIVNNKTKMETKKRL